MLHHVFLVAISVLALDSTAATDLSCASERSALLEFRARLGGGGGGGGVLESWSSGATVSSSWRGVTLGSRGQVVKLELSSLELTGELYPVWDFLPALQVMNLSHNSLGGRLDFSSSCGGAALVSLDLSFNRLAGPVREEVRRFQALQLLRLDHNGLSGELPRGLFELRSLVALDLSWNNFSGPVSSDFELLRRMELLDLSHNNFSGALPASNLSRMAALAKLDVSSNALDSIKVVEMGLFQQLRTLDLSSNSFSGNLPEFVFATTSLEVLNLSSNQFTGPVREKASGERRIRVLDMASNALTGDLSGLVGLTLLEHLNLAGNNLSGTIPSELGHFANLTMLDLCANEFQGGIPDSFSNLAKLEHLKVSNNLLSYMPDVGVSLPKSLRVLSAGSNLFSGPLRVSYNSAPSTLEVLYLPENRFTGPLPPELGQLKNLKKIILNQNSFVGSIPPSIAHCQLLEEIWINSNLLTGHIPPELFTLKHLRALVLANNSLSGSPVPLGISQSKTLEVLWLEQNNFSGPISSEVGQLSNLLMLSLASNKLTGHIPASLGKLTNLVGLDLGLNALSGRIPDELADLSSIQFLFLSGNRMEQRIPGWIGNLSRLRAVDLSFNRFSGSIPTAWSNSTLTSLSPRYSDKPPSALVYNNEGQRFIGYALPTTLDFSHNELVGGIPAELGALRNLQILNLSHNRLQGSIPPSLGNVPALLKLDLSRNNLTGTIPQALCKLTFLSDLDLSDNHLKGAIPSSTQFQTFGNSSFAGNPDLCGAPLPECRLEQDEARSDIGTISAVQKLIPLYVVIAGSLGFCGFWVLFIILIRKRQKLLSQEEDEDEYSKKKRYLNSSEVSNMSEGVAWIHPNELMSATSNYSHANIIGDGGFGIVYKAILADGSAVAVKKLITDGGFGMQGEREFLAEMQTLGKIKHKNLVCLKGYSCDGKDRILVYKYLKNGNLDTWLHCRDAGVKPLDWKTRFHIILGAARGITFLHHECFPPIVHRDIKASNILLDEDFQAHVADFGLARLMRDAGDTHVSTDVAGTVGYIPPEYNSSCMATMRGDVYSFGVVVLETIMGKRPTDKGFRRAGGIGHLAGERVTVQELQSAIDAAMLAENTTASPTNAAEVSAEILEVMKIACLCCVDKPGKRPEMTHVVRMLEGVERRHSNGASNLVSPPSVDGGSKHFLNNVET
ncbi:brassinosteroid LRR receptor kinase BRL1 [Selaginella moellendorffii]|uniref:brassinosteroid LRR receptor kinase BRL1 n=1 Tax=Selaginella moellendorffii TaxID=88036 RepID=UPI000D1C6A02|nr:brassinosteroid LRR receptor kinase BRL1 [Selaginella moellendorffii]|eukprot:XP_024526367.1 brassinosteroid LRR receptor kinase BRL1 [Selaginella moellendorffii]